MRRLTIATLFAFTCLLGASGPARASGGACPSCAAKLDIVSTTLRRGDLFRDPDSTFAEWAAGTVVLSCDDGDQTQSVTLALAPGDLAEGVEVEDQALPASVDLSSSALECWIDVDTDLQSAVIDVDLI